jgi:hypothetical protein
VDEGAVIDRTGQTWRVMPDGHTYLFVRSWSTPEGTCHEIVSMDDGVSEEWLESTNHSPLEWRDGTWKRIA